MADEEVAKQEEETVEATAEGAGEEETPASTVPAVRYIFYKSPSCQVFL